MFVGDRRHLGKSTEANIVAAQVFLVYFQNYYHYAIKNDMEIDQ